MNTAVVILASGFGTRMRSKHAKVLHRAGGRAIIEYVVAAAAAVAAPENIVAVTGSQGEEVEAVLAPYKIAFVRQGELRGSGHALTSCREKLKHHDGLLVVLYGDTPLLKPSLLVMLCDEQAKSNAAATLITTTLTDPTGYARVLLNDAGTVEGIVEHRDATPSQLAIRVVSSGIFCFHASLLWKHIGEIEPRNPAREYYISDMVRVLTRHGHSVDTMHLDNSTELSGVNNRVELAEADRFLRARKALELMLSGVTIELPDTVVIDATVRVGCDTVIEAFARLLGSTQIGEDCRIGSGSVLQSVGLANGVVVAPHSIISNSRIGSGATIGPFARVVVNAEIGAHAVIGNFPDMTKGRGGHTVKSQHVAYFGDEVIGERGVITNPASQQPVKARLISTRKKKV